MNTTAAIDQSCVEYYSRLGTPWKCMFGQHSLPYIETPIFVLQTIYDFWQMQQILVHQYPNEIAEWGQLMFTAASTVNSLNWHGIWLTGCYKHCAKYKEIVIDGINTPEAFQMFKNGTKRIWSQGLPDYPCNSCCGVFVESDAATTEGSTLSASTALIIDDSATIYIGGSTAKT